MYVPTHSHINIHNLATKNSRCPSFAATQNMILNQAALMHMHSGFGSKLKMICDTPLTMAQAAMAPTTMPRCTLPPTPSHEEATTRSISTSDVESAGEGAKLEEVPLEKKSSEKDPGVPPLPDQDKKLEKKDVATMALSLIAALKNLPKTPKKRPAANCTTTSSEVKKLGSLEPYIYT